jgi:hypothetical protein
MEYALLVAPDLDLTPDDIAVVWNADAQASSLAHAQLTPAPAQHFNPLLDSLVTLITASGGTIGVGLLTNALYDVLKAAVIRKHGQPPQKRFKITQLDQPDGTHLLVIEQDETTP